ncbi:MAG TPA: roadblock/LC7 domain-containing protein [Planctomycetota bacterium]|nr:roadblock/LC7 domain-containing protein [Planctomycetota bacterium]
MNDTERLREERLVFYREEVVRLEALLKELLSLSGAKCALLVDKDGHLVLRAGQARGFDLDTVAALVAGSFAATREMARLLGEDEFSVMFHQGKRDNIQLSLVGDRTILTIIFDDQTTVGMVRLYANEAARKLTALFEQLAKKGGDRGGVELASDYEASAKNRLEALFPEP